MVGYPSKILMNYRDIAEIIGEPRIAKWPEIGWDSSDVVKFDHSQRPFPWCDSPDLCHASMDGDAFSSANRAFGDRGGGNTRAATRLRCQCR
jgi:hypothetical protein